MRTQRTIFVLVIFFLLTLILRKLGVGFTSIILNVVTAVLALTLLFSKDIFRTLLAKLCLAVSLIGALLILQYKLESEYIIIPCIIALFFFMLFSFKYVIHKRTGLIVFIPIFSIYLLNVVLNPRQFHNLFRSTSFEDYILNKYRLDQAVYADLTINRYKVVDQKKSDQYLAMAIREDSLRNTESAMEYYSKSISYNPDNAVAYHRRGYLKLSEPNVDWTNATSSLKDLSRAIRLNPNFPEAYFHRALAYSILGYKERASSDRQKVLQLDSLTTDSAFQVKYGISKKSLTVPPDS